MVPQIIYLILQFFGLIGMSIKYSRDKKSNELHMYILGLIINTILLYYGGFYNVFTQTP